MSEWVFNKARVFMLLKEGRLAAVCGALSSEKLAPKSTGCLSTLRSKHLAYNWGDRYQAPPLTEHKIYSV